MQQLIEKFQEKIGKIDTSKIMEIMLSGQIKQLKAGEHIVQEGARFTKIATVINGLLRVYQVSEEGIEHTNIFIAETEAVQTMSNWKEDIPVKENIQAIEDTTVVLHERDKLKEMMITDPELTRFYILAMEERLAFSAERHNMLNMNKPEERYKWLMENESHLINRVQQQYLASYLGIIPSSLSRIKKRMMEEND